jgi:hypothetical protein
MKSRHKKAGKRLYITARDMRADIPPPAVARRLTVQPKVTEAKRLLSKTPAPGRRNSAGAKAAAALGAFLDEWEKEHGPFTSVELARAGKELTAMLEDRADTELRRTVRAPDHGQSRANRGQHR